MDIHATIALLLIIYSERTDSASRCMSYPEPKNGYITCDSLFHLFCSPECHPGFRFASKPAVVYMCGPVTGEWFTYPVGSTLPWPDCIPEDRSDNTIHEEMAKKREEITRYIADSNTGIPSPYYSQAKKIDPEERYHHLYDYIEKAQKAYEYREAIEKETEKLKLENGDVNENITESQMNSYKNQPSIASKTPRPLAYANADLQHSLVAQKEQILRNDQNMAVKHYLAPVQNKIPEITEKKNEFSPQKINLTQSLSANSFPIVSQVARNPQLTNARSRMANPVENNTSRYKQNSNFVLKMLNNEEFKDLHYLDEHVRLNRNAPTSINKTSTQRKSSELQKDKKVGKNSSKSNLVLLRAESRKDVSDNSTRNTNIAGKENEDMSNHVVPIVMSQTSLINSVASLLKKDNVKDTNETENRGISNSQDIATLDKQNSKVLKSGNTSLVYMFPQNFSSNKKNIYFRNKSKIQLNENRQNVSGSSDVLDSRKNMKDFYQSWLKNHEKSLDLYRSEEKTRRKNISLQTNSLPRKRPNPVTVQSAKNKAAENTMRDVNSIKEEKEVKNEKQVQEHIFYFPIKKDTLFEILNETNAMSKS